jgi:sugar (pentulose or hexulose) kinase
MIKSILQEPNDVFKKGDYFYWNIKKIFTVLKKGIALAVAETDKINSMGICTWGVDFALIDEKGVMVEDPLAHRNVLGKEELDKFSPEERVAMFYRTGILSDKINTVFMIKAMQSKMPELFYRGKTLLMIPDILNYFFTGNCYNEVSEASTTQLLDVRTMKYSPGQCDATGINRDIFPSVVEHGICLGNVLPEIKKELGIHYDIPVVCVPSHDTASAVLGTPVLDETFAFISAGTWALIGFHCREPIITEKVLNQGFTNEVGGFGHITLLKNSVGMFVYQKLRSDYIIRKGRKISWDEFEGLADAFTGEELLFDVNDSDFFNPDSMFDAVNAYLLRTGQIKSKGDWPAVISSAVYSLAVSFAAGLKGVGEIVGINLTQVVMVGGGARSRRLSQLVADISGIEVISCSMECSTIGNALAQAAFACKELAYKDLRRIATASLETVVYSPMTDKSRLLNKLPVHK